jgi:toxin YoeB
MKYKITIEDQALKHISYFQKRDKEIIKKIQHLFSEMLKNPFEGIGKPESLRFELSGCWSRRITREHRVAYKVVGREIRVLSCRFHY